MFTPAYLTFPDAEAAAALVVLAAVVFAALVVVTALAEDLDVAEVAALVTRVVRAVVAALLDDAIQWSEIEAHVLRKGYIPVPGTHCE